MRAQDVWARLPAVVSRLCESSLSVVSGGGGSTGGGGGGGGAGEL